MFRLRGNGFCNLDRQVRKCLHVRFNIWKTNHSQNSLFGCHCLTRRKRKRSKMKAPETIDCALVARGKRCRIEQNADLTENFERSMTAKELNLDFAAMQKYEPDLLWSTAVQEYHSAKRSPLTCFLSRIVWAAKLLSAVPEDRIQQQRNSGKKK